MMPGNTAVLSYLSSK